MGQWGTRSGSSGRGPDGRGPDYDPRKDPYRDQARLAAVEAMLLVRLDDLLAELGVGLQEAGGVYSGPCPVHGGDNPGGFNLYTRGDRREGPFWLCYTRGCNRVFQSSLLGLVRGLLSRDKGWEWGGSEFASWKSTVDWCCHFLGQKYADFEVDYKAAEKGRFAHDVARLAGPAGAAAGGGWPRPEVESFLKPPSEYFLSRGYSEGVLRRYCVGDYPAEGRPLSGRAVAPVFDPSGARAVGFSGRSVHPQCPACGRWHPPGDCPREGTAAWKYSCKWYHHELNTRSALYNLHAARDHVRETGVAVLVEGPGDVWRLVEGGVEVGLATFGAHLSDEQQCLLEASGCVALVVPRDRDAAGEAFEKDLRARLSRSFRLSFPELPAHDVGDLTPAQVAGLILPAVRKLSW